MLTDPDLADGNLRIAARAATRVHRRVRKVVPLEDLVAYGCIGLVESAQRYTPERGASFQTFSEQRVYGAIYDGLRLMNWFGRAGTRHRQASSAISAEGRAAAGRSSEWGMTLIAADDSDELGRLLRERGAVDEDIAGRAPEENADPLVRKRLHAALARLHPRERLLLEHHYGRGLDLRTAGARIGLHGRHGAQRMHVRVLQKLRCALAA
jgi:RNA polymerase sigma factor FliA